MTTDAFRQHVDRLKAATSGQAIAADLGLTGRGRRYFCPACQASGGKTPDLAISDTSFHCFKCGQAGDLIDLVVLTNAGTKADAIRWLETRTGIAPDRRSPGRAGSKAASVKIVAPRVSQAARPGGLTPVSTKPVAPILPSAVALYDTFLTTVCRPLAGTPGA